MADNTELNPGSGGDTIATDQISGIKYQYIKLTFGGDGVVTPVTGAAPLPVTDAALTTAISGVATQATIAAILATEGGAADAIVAAGAAGSISAKMRRLTQGVEDLKSGIELAAFPTDPFGLDADAIVAAGAAGSHSAKLRRLTQGVEDLKTNTMVDPLGANADAVVAAGAAGSISAKLRRISQSVEELKTTIAIASFPSDPFGAVADASVAAGASGTISAKLRRISQGIEDLKTGIVLAASTNVVTVAGGVAHDAADSGNPMKTGARARTALPDAVAQNDRADTISDKFGRTIVTDIPIDQHVDGNGNFTNNSAANILAGSANTQIVVTSIIISNAHASVGTKVEIRDGTTVKMQPFAGTGGGGVALSDKNGLFVATVNTAVTARCVTTGADVDVFIAGYKIPA